MTKIIEGFLKSKDLQYDKPKMPGKLVRYAVPLGGLGGVIDKIVVHYIVDQEKVQSLVVLPVSAAKNMAKMAEFIVRVNYTMRYGHFDMDFRDGEVRYRMSFPVEGIKKDPNKFLDMLIGIPSCVVSTFSVGIVDVLQGKSTPEDAINACMKKASNR